MRIAIRKAKGNQLYSKENGKYYAGIINGLASYGIPERNISFVNYFADTKNSAAEKIEKADIVYFLGGLPDRMMERKIDWKCENIRQIKSLSRKASHMNEIRRVQTAGLCKGCISLSGAEGLLSASPELNGMGLF